MVLKVLQPTDELAITFLEKEILKARGFGKEEQELFSWGAPWRKESLEHYLPLGWSFGLWSDKNFMAYTLAQPLLFFQSYSQSLWVEHISAIGPSDSMVKEGESAEEFIRALILALYGWAKSKHLQNLILFLSSEAKDQEKNHFISSCLEQEVGPHSLEKMDNCIIVKTAQYRGR